MIREVIGTIRLSNSVALRLQNLVMIVHCQHQANGNHITAQPQHSPGPVTKPMSSTAKRVRQGAENYQLSDFGAWLEVSFVQLPFDDPMKRMSVNRTAFESRCDIGEDLRNLLMRQRHHRLRVVPGLRSWTLSSRWTCARCARNCWLPCNVSESLKATIGR